MMLKDFLLAAFTPNKWQRAQRILTIQELGDHCALHVTDFLLWTLGDLDPGVLLQYVLLRCLPPHVQHVTSPQTGGPKSRQHCGHLLLLPSVSVIIAPPPTTHRSLKSALQARLTYLDWHIELPWVLWGCDAPSSWILTPPPRNSPFERYLFFIHL